MRIYLSLPGVAQRVRETIARAGYDWEEIYDDKGVSFLCDAAGRGDEVLSMVRAIDPGASPTPLG